MSHPWYAATLMVMCVAPAAAQTANRGPEAPPAASRGVNESRRASDANWGTRRTRHAVVRALAGSAAERKLGSDADRAEGAIVANLKWLRATALGAPLELYFVGSTEAMERLAGQQPAANDGTAFFVSNASTRPALKRETMRLLARRAWGAAAESWLSEGVATSAVGDCQGYTIDQIVAAARTAGMFAPLDTLRSAFAREGELGLVHRMEAASLVRYVDRMHGRAKLKALWSAGSAGIDDALGVDAQTLEAKWRQGLSRTPLKSSWPTVWKRIQARGCE